MASRPDRRSTARHVAPFALAAAFALPAARAGDTARLEVAELGFVGPVALAVEAFSFVAPVPLPPNPPGRELVFTVPGGSGSVGFASALQSGQLLASPAFSFTRTQPHSFRTVTAFDATVREIATTVPTAPAGAAVEEAVTLAFVRYEIVDSLLPPAGTALYVDTATHTSTLKVPGSAPPVLAPVGPQSVPSGGQLTLTLLVTDADTPDPAILLSASYPATPLLPPGSVVLSGGAPDPKLALSPAAGVAGMVAVTLTASDGTSQGHASFLLTVTGTAGAPTDIVLSNDTIPETAPDGSMVATVAVVDPDAGDSHTLTLSDDAAGRFALVGADLVVADTSRLDFELTNAHEITITAVDLSGNAFAKSFVIHLTDVVEGAFDAWRALHFSPAQLADPAVSGYLADPDRDGRTNLEEYSGGSDPLDGASIPPPLVLGAVPFQGGDHSTITWRQIDPTFDPNLGVQPQISHDMQIWTEGALAFTVIATVPAAPGYQDITARVNAPQPAVGGEFFRLRIAHASP